jgi:hypothetical protein
VKAHGQLALWRAAKLQDAAPVDIPLANPAPDSDEHSVGDSSIARHDFE